MRVHGNGNNKIDDWKYLIESLQTPLQFDRRSAVDGADPRAVAVFNVLRAANQVDSQAKYDGKDFDAEFDDFARVSRSGSNRRGNGTLAHSKWIHGVVSAIEK